MKHSKVFVTVLLVVVLVLGIVAARYFSSAHRKPSPSALSAAKAKGNPNAALQVTEYTDFQCPACANGTRLIKEYLQAYPQKFYVRYRHYPLDMHPRAFVIAVAGECAARQNKFWKFHDLAFERQNLLRETLNLQERLLEIGKECGLESSLFEKCQADPATAQAVKAERAEGEARKVGATPTYFMGEQMVVGPNALRQEFEKKIGRLP